MISRAQMEVYHRFGGDIDGLVRIGTAAERALMPSDIWWTVDRLRAGLIQVRAGLAAPEYAARVEAEVASEIADAEARAILLRLVDADVCAHHRDPAG